MEKLPQEPDKETQREALVEELNRLRAEELPKDRAVHDAQLELDGLRKQIKDKELELAKFDGRA
jgi:predicted  nucleic acid-binding Zn-ribbon protein